METIQWSDVLVSFDLECRMGWVKPMVSPNPLVWDNSMGGLWTLSSYPLGLEALMGWEKKFPTG